MAIFNIIPITAPFSDIAYILILSGSKRTHGEEHEQKPKTTRDRSTSFTNSGCGTPCDGEPCAYSFLITYLLCNTKSVSSMWNSPRLVGFPLSVPIIHQPIYVSIMCWILNSSDWVYTT